MMHVYITHLPKSGQTHLVPQASIILFMGKTFQRLYPGSFLKTSIWNLTIFPRHSARQLSGRGSLLDFCASRDRNVLLIVLIFGTVVESVLMCA